MEVKALDRTQSIDLIGIVFKCDDVTTCTLRSGKQKDKRMVSFTDESGYVI